MLFRMRRTVLTRSSLAVWILALAMSAPLTSAAAFDPTQTSQVPVRIAPSEAAAIEARWRRQVCTAAGCAGAVSQPWSHAAGFGAVAVAAGWLGRRRR